MDKETLLALYRQMVIIRQFETRVKELYGTGEISGHSGLYIGQEAVAVGACANLRVDDYITSTHRSHGHCLAKGADMKAVMAELFERDTGLCRGKGGSMHLADMANGILGANGIVGGGLAMASGSGLSAQMRGTDQVTVCFFGDGASNQTTFHEGLNLAAVWDLPIVYVCENNEYGLSLHQSKHQRIVDVADRGPAYGMPGIVVNGNDVLDVYNKVGEAIERARSGQGPTLIEAKTYLWRGHSEDAGTDYRRPGELQQWQERCPIALLSRHLVGSDQATVEELESIEGEVGLQVDLAVDFARSSPAPALQQATTDVYAQ